MQGYSYHRVFLPKEVAMINLLDGHDAYFYVKTNGNWKDLPEGQMKSTYRYQYHKVHGIPWRVGSSYDVKKMMKEEGYEDNDLVLVKGAEKQLFLSSMMKNVVNLEGLPSFKDMTSDKHCKNKHLNCAFTHVHAIFDHVYKHY